MTRRHKRDTELWIARWDKARTQRRWRTPILPIPDHIDTLGKLMRASQINGVDGRRVLDSGYVNLGQAERIAAAEEKHPTEIWGRLWTDVAELDNRIEADARRLKRFALTYRTTTGP